MNTKTTATATNTLAFVQAHAHILPLAAALDQKELRVINVDLEYAAGLVLGKMQRLLSLRAVMAQLPDFDVACVDELGNCAMALIFSHGRYVAMSTPIDLSEARTEAIALRTLFKGDAQGLVNRRLLEPALLTNLANTTGDREIAGDLMALYAGFLAASAKVAGKTAVTDAELARAAELSQLLMLGASQREEPRTEATVALATERQRIFTLFLHYYDQARRAVGFLRWNRGDADDYAPSLYAAHARHSKDATPGAVVDSPTAPVAPAPAAPVTHSGFNPILEALLAAAPQHPVPQNDPFKR